MNNEKTLLCILMATVCYDRSGSLDHRIHCMGRSGLFLRLPDLIMIEIFIPVLFVCLNGTCNFMQAQTHYRSEAQCRASIDNQKIHLLEVIEKANQGKATILEGTCISAQVQDEKGRA